MKNAITFILILSLVCISLFVNYYNIDSRHVWNLIYYFQYYFIVFGFIILIWMCFDNTLIRSLTIPIGAYYLFHLIVNIIEIFNEPLKKLIYQGKNINYIIGISLCIALIILPLHNIFKKWNS